MRARTMAHVWGSVLLAGGVGLAAVTARCEGVGPARESDFPFDAAEAKRRQAEAARALGVPAAREVALADGVGMTFALIPPGSFPRMRNRQARITRAFYLGVHEVTQAQWAAVVGRNPSFFKDREDSPDRPVERVTWDDIADTFLPALQKLAPTGMRFRLPTEAEWEHACRAGTETGYAFGATLTPEMANIGDSGLRQTVAVGTYAPNAWGLYDMHGNVAEWCEDWYDAEYYPRAPTDDPANRDKPAFGGRRVMRGGSWINEAYNNRSVERLRQLPGYRNSNTGVRLVLSF